jgi:phage baseplate assembly protein W
MPSIKLDNLTTTREPADHLYKDLSLDLEEETILTGSLYREKVITDIKSSIDEAAIKNSLSNLFTTMPGQKLLNPDYGLSINQFLFQPLTEDVAEEIGNRILTGIETYEPRVLVKNVNVNLDTVQSQYDIYLTLVIPALSNSTVKFTGILQQPGFEML